MNTVRLSLRTWLLALSLLSTLPLLALSLSVLWDYKAYQQRVLVEQLEQQAHGLSRSVAEHLNAAVSALASLAESDAAQQRDIRALHAHAQRVVARNRDFRAITLVDSSDEILFLSQAPLGGARFKTNAHALVLEALRTQSPNVSGPFPSPISPIQVVAVTVPVIINGQADQALRLILPVSLFNQMITPDRLPKDWVVGLADRNGILVARSHAAERFVGQPASGSFQSAITTGNRQVFEGSTLEGLKTLNLVLPVFGADWYLGVGVPLTALHEPVDDMLLHAALLTALWLSASVLAAALLAHYLVRQMNLTVGTLERGQTALPAGQAIRVQELWDLLQRFWITQQDEATARRDLHHVALQRDEVQDLYDLAPCGYHSLDEQGKVVRMNQTELGWLGQTLAQVRGRPFSDFLTEASRDIFREKFPEFARDGFIKDLELELVRGTGTPMPVLISATALRDDDGRFVMSRSTVFDNTDQKMMEAQLDRLARTDMLTALSNRRDFYDQAAKEVARSLRHDHPLSLLLMDIDHFKKINDTHGHAAGDRVLRSLSHRLVDALREVDVAARMGGEEFAVLMPETAADQALQVAERLRATLEQVVVDIDDGPPVRFTVSIGVALWNPADADIDATLARADAALYRAKHQGRNRVES